MPENEDNPRAFISHASDDKERFVVPFAQGLRANGIDAWLDKWEIKPGDSIVDKIFEVGIAKAKIFIVILSKNSIEKKWVKEELDAAIVARVSKQSRIIPIRLDDCPVPEALRATAWINASDKEVSEIVMEVVNVAFGITSKPPIGDPPKQAENAGLKEINGLTALDARILHMVVDQVIESNRGIADLSEIRQQLVNDGFNLRDIED